MIYTCVLMTALGSANIEVECRPESGDGPIYSQTIPKEMWPNAWRDIDEMKAIQDAEGLRAIPGCEERIEQALEEYCGDNYCRPPINSMIPDDCVEGVFQENHAP